MVLGDPSRRAGAVPHAEAVDGVKRAQCDYWDLLYGWSKGAALPPRRNALPNRRAVPLWS